MTNNQSKTSGTLPAPPPITAKWIKYVLSFGVTAVVGLAPYLGKVRIPLFPSILTFIPIFQQDMALTLSSAAMGVVAVSVQWYGTEHLTKRKMRRWFVMAMSSTVVAFLILIGLHTWVAVPVRVDAQDTYVVVGPSQTAVSPCEGLGASECIRKKLTLDPATIATHFGERRVALSSMGVIVAYVAFTASFAWLVALLVFKDK
jgi:hypothetical protein